MGEEVRSVKGGSRTVVPEQNAALSDEGRGPTRRGRGEESGGGRARTTDATINCTKFVATGGGHLTGTDFFVAEQIKVWRKEIEELDS